MWRMGTRTFFCENFPRISSLSLKCSRKEELKTAARHIFFGWGAVVRSNTRQYHLYRFHWIHALLIDSSNPVPSCHLQPPRSHLSHWQCTHEMSSSKEKSGTPSLATLMSIAGAQMQWFTDFLEEQVLIMSWLVVAAAIDQPSRFSPISLSSHCLSYTHKSWVYSTTLFIATIWCSLLQISSIIFQNIKFPIFCTFDIRLSGWGDSRLVKHCLQRSVGSFTRLILIALNPEATFSPQCTCLFLGLSRYFFLMLFALWMGLCYGRGIWKDDSPNRSHLPILPLIFKGAPILLKGSCAVIPSGSMWLFSIPLPLDSQVPPAGLSTRHNSSCTSDRKPLSLQCRST